MDHIANASNSWAHERACAGSHTPQETDEAIKYKAPFVLPWIVIDDAMANQPESFVPFTAGSQGAPAAPHVVADICVQPIHLL